MRYIFFKKTKQTLLVTEKRRDMIHFQKLEKSDEKAHMLFKQPSIVFPLFYAGNDYLLLLPHR